MTSAEDEVKQHFKPTKYQPEKICVSTFRIKQNNL
jgi:hypothetical protein